MQTHIALWSDPIESTPVCSQTEITGSGRKFEHSTIWTMVWSWSGQISNWSEKSDLRRIRAHLSLIINRFERSWVWSETHSSALEPDHKRFERNWVWSEMFSNAVVSDQGPFRGPYFFFFFLVFFYWEMLALPRVNNRAAFWSETHLKSNSSDQKKGVQLIAKTPSKEILINRRPQCFLWEAV